MSNRILSLAICLSVCMLVGACSEKETSGVVDVVEETEKAVEIAEGTKTPLPVNAHEEDVLSIETIIVDNEIVKNENPAILKKEMLFLPASVFESMRMDVEWEAAEQSLLLRNNEMALMLTASVNEADLNGQPFPLMAAPEVREGMLYVPSHIVEGAIGGAIYYDPYMAEVTIFTPSYIKDYQIDLAQLNTDVEMYLAEMEQNRMEAEETKSDGPEQSDGQENTDTTPTPAGPVDMKRLSGMYAGFRPDTDGYACGGMCWDFYTFLPKKRVVIGLPAKGGPETVDCQVDECLTYSIKGNQLKLSNGDTVAIDTSAKGAIMLGGVQMAAVEPVQSGLKLNDTYKYTGYSGLIGINPAATSWTYVLRLETDGQFELTGTSLGSLAMPGSAISQTDSNGREDRGTYSIEGNTITLKSADGSIHQALFFLHDGDKEDIQVGLRNYYVD